MYQVKICMHENKNYTPLKISSTQCKFENGKVAISTAFKQNCNKFANQLSYTVNIYRYKAIGANATSSVISTTWECISPCLEILQLLQVILQSLQDYLQEISPYSFVPINIYSVVGRLPHSHFQCTALSFVKHGQKCKIKVISPNVTEYLLCFFDEI